MPEREERKKKTPAHVLSFKYQCCPQVNILCSNLCVTTCNFFDICSDLGAVCVWFVCLWAYQLHCRPECVRRNWLECLSRRTGRTIYGKLSNNILIHTVVIFNHALCVCVCARARLSLSLSLSNIPPTPIPESWISGTIIPSQTAEKTHILTVPLLIAYFPSVIPLSSIGNG
jgi:hypothetical protein